MKPLQLSGALWLAWFVYWMIAARKTKATVESESYFTRLLYSIPLILAFFAIFDRAFPSLGTWPVELKWFGVALTIIGLSFAIWARLHLGRNWSGRVTLKKDHELIRSGPYSLVRHPIYTGMFLGAIGAALTAGRPIGIPAVFVILAAFSWKIRLEERLMRRQFGEKYEAYRRDVKALIPYLI